MRLNREKERHVPSSRLALPGRIFVSTSLTCTFSVDKRAPYLSFLGGSRDVTRQPVLIPYRVYPREIPS
jgi:hypothetical protein